MPDGHHDHRTRDLSDPDLARKGGDPQWSASTVGGDAVLSTRFSPGSLIDRNYRVIRPLGHGGMGLVLHVVDERLQRNVALKVLNLSRSLGSSVREQFLTEARAMARVRHPNVVQIHAFGEHLGSPYFVMEYVPGVDLREWLRSHATLPLAIDEALGILDQLCRGVHAIHQAGAVHGDIKPGNVLIGPAFRVALADFGLARRASGTDPSRLAAGTPAYAAPELLQEPGAGPASDIYSLGVVAYELLTGRLPFEAEDAETMVAAHATATPPRPSEVRPDLSPVFDAVLLSALAKQPSGRPHDAQVLRVGLAEARELVTRSTEAPDVRILVADDDRGTLRATRELLQDMFPRATIECVPDGRQALAQAVKTPPSLAIIDLRMPGLDGIELTRALRASARTRDVPIIVVTGEGGAPDWRKLQALGADGFLVKPVDGYALASLARRSLAANGHASA